MTDLRSLIEHEGPFLTAVLPAPSSVEDASRRFEVEWRNARKQLTPEKFSAAELSSLDEEIGQQSHGEGEALVVIHPAGGSTFFEFLNEPVSHPLVDEGPLPRLGVIIEARQRTVAHMVVDTDRTGADIIGFSGGEVTATDTVEGERLHIQRSAPGGWSQRRFQQRAENTWERNAGQVIDAIVAMASDIHPVLIAVAGDVRAQQFVLDGLPTSLAHRAIKIEAGSPAGIADEVVKLAADHVAREFSDLADRLRATIATGTGVIGVPETLAALGEGRVEVLLLHDDPSDVATIAERLHGAPAGSRAVDAAIFAGLVTNADIRLVPSLAMLDGGMGAILRW